MSLFHGLEICHYAFKRQLKRDSDSIVLYYNRNYMYPKSYN